MVTIASLPAVIAVGVLGPLQVRVRGAEVAIAGRRERCVLAALAVSAGQVVSSSTLTDHIWGDDPPRTAHKSLQTAVANLRKAIRDAGADDACLQTSGSGYRIELGDDDIDVRRFEHLVSAGRRALAVGEAEQASGMLAEALALWRGDGPADLGDGIAAAIDSQRLVDLRLEALADRLDAGLLSGRHQDALAELGVLCATWPLRERFHELRALALYRAGRQSDALEVVARLRERLLEHGGLDPGERIRDVEGRILRHDPTLEPAARPRARRRPRMRLVGRDHDLAAVGRLVKAHRLVTIVGPGGVGKTSLAAFVAADAVGLETVTCSLGHVSDPDHVVPALATALGLQQRADVTMRRAVRESLAAGPTLLVLDNCEHLLDAVGELTPELIDECEELVVLATSRERLSVAGEAVWPLDGLGVPRDDDTTSEAVELFLDRARAADPRFDAGDDAIAHVCAICRSLDGLPLAIELAAARVRALPLAEIVRRLDDRFELFGSGTATHERRNRSLYAAVAWSYDLLGEREQRLFRRLSVFAGSFTLDAAEAVGALDDLDRAGIPALLADLVDKSMVTVGHDELFGQYKLLETLRAFGRRRLDESGETDTVETAFLGFQRRRIAVLAEEAAGAGEPDAVTEIQSSFDNIRRAVAVARGRRDVDALADLVGGLCTFLRFRVRWEANAWAQDALELFEATAPADPGSAARVAAAALWGLWFAGDLDRADVIADAAVRGDRADDASWAELLTSQSLMAMYRQDPDAISMASEALSLADDAGRAWLAAYLCGQIAIMHAYAGEFDAAAPHLTRQARLVDGLGNATARAWSLYCQAEVCGEADPAETVRLAREGTTAAIEARSHMLESICRITALTVEARHGDVTATLGEFAALIARFRRDGSWTHLMVVVWNLVEALHRIDEDRATAVLLHARPSGAPVPYGVQLGRLDAIKDRLARTMPDADFERARSTGVALTREGTAEVALATLQRLAVR